MNHDLRYALNQELEAKQTLLDQLRTLAVEDPDFFIDLIEGETNLIELIAALDASIVDDETLADGAKATLDKLQARKRAAEHRIELKRRLLAHTVQQITATLASVEALHPLIPGVCIERRHPPHPSSLTIRPIIPRSWRERNRHALREFWARVPAALGVKQELEKALAQDGNPTK
jgi:hypothetical protein